MTMARMTEKRETLVTRIMLGIEDREACERLIARNPTVRNITDAVRYAIHFTDKAEA